MRTLVTGCAGFIGSHLVDSLVADGHEVIGIDCFNDNYHRRQKLTNLRHVSDWDGFEFIPIDLARGDLRGIADECELIFHLAAEPGVRSSWGARYENYLRNNVLATQHVLEAVKHRTDVRVVYASSSSVYGNALARPTKEDTPLHPVSPYGQTKAAMEHLCELYLLSHGVDVVGLRYFTVYGPRQRPDMAFHLFSRALLEGQPINVYGDGLQTRDFTYVDDVVRATRAAAGAQLGEHRIFNIGGGSPASLREVLTILRQVAGRDVDVVYGQTERGDVRDTAADASRARAELGFEPQVALADGLASQFAWMRDFVESAAVGDAR
jgi:nucleoside-diphosphate-sugar epimerase